MELTIIGIDPHNRSHTAVVLDDTELIATEPGDRWTEAGVAAACLGTSRPTGLGGGERQSHPGPPPTYADGHDTDTAGHLVVPEPPGIDERPDRPLTQRGFPRLWVIRSRLLGESTYERNYPCVQGWSGRLLALPEFILTDARVARDAEESIATVELRRDLQACVRCGVIELHPVHGRRWHTVRHLPVAGAVGPTPARTASIMPGAVDAPRPARRWRCRRPTSAVERIRKLFGVGWNTVIRKLFGVGWNTVMRAVLAAAQLVALRPPGSGSMRRR